MKHLYLLLLTLLAACNSQSDKKTLFTRLSASQTGIEVVNQLDLKEDFDVFRYRNYYNGGGVAIGDINNDGLSDIFITTNTRGNKLYLNQGNLKFKDISKEAGIEGTKVWSTGVVMADVNGDGWLDIYVCNSGDIKGEKRENELFINSPPLPKGDGETIPPKGGQRGAWFKESAKKYGLDDNGFSTHAAFFDYDLDGDLDCYLLNNSFRPIGSFGLENIRHIRDDKGGDKLFRNEGGKFTDVSEEAGIYGSVIGFGLGIAVSDLNMDGYPDMYVSNDFFERDYLYMNQKDGTFKECLTDCIRHTSEFSMGSDIGDLNNDGFPEIFATDMLPEDDYRLKTTQSFLSYDIQQQRLKNDYYDQFMRNTLQLNNGNGTFSEIGLYAGVARTDWSWGALIADYDNDGSKEIFITNGIYKDVTNQDFINFMANDERLEKIYRGEKINFKELVDKMPSTKLKNYLFKKQANRMKFDNVAALWGLDEPSFSNGAAYGDLDNDGDLDLVVNNVNQEIFFYRNNSEKQTKNHFIKLKFKGEAKNVFGIGAKICLTNKSNKIFYENFPSRGFQSSVDNSATLGLGTWTQIDSLIITWVGGKKQILRNVQADKTLIVDIKNATKTAETTPKPNYIASEIKLEPEFIHQENNFVDFNRESLLYQMLSREGPALATGDLNGDGLDDFYIGGAAGQSSALYLQNADGQAFILKETSAFEKDKEYEDIDAKFFDADNDGDLDLYVVSGGNEHQAQSGAYQDRLYLNQGTKNNPQFVRKSEALPNFTDSGSCVEVADFDGDGDLDLFVGSRSVPGKYGQSASSYLLENDGKGNFKDVSSERIPQLKYLGMVTDAVWMDYDGDNLLDLIIVGDWMPVVIFQNKGVGFQKLKTVKGLEQSHGCWNTVSALDINKDGKKDLVLGNLGLNSRFKASVKNPFHLFINDFDDNGAFDHIYAHYQNEKLVPFSLKQDLTGQIPSLKKKFLYFKDYADKSVEDVFGKEKIESSIVLKAFTFASCVALNKGRGSFDLKELPEEAQLSTIRSVCPIDFDADGKEEIVLAGNFSSLKPELGKYNASYGLVLKIDSKGNWQALPPKKSGLSVRGDVRQVALLNSINGNKLIIFARNNEKPKFIRINQQTKQ